MNKRLIRNYIRLSGALIFGIIYIPHLLIYLLKRGGLIKTDVERMFSRQNLKLPSILSLLFLLHNDAYFRTLFYHRIGPILTLMISWYRPGDKHFIISARTKIGASVLMAHPYATVLNAESIGDNFNFRHLTTLGDKDGKRPIIGNNVSLGAAVTIIGGVTIGDNVEIGAGTVVVKDLPPDCVAVGNPARIIRYKSPKN